MSMTRVTLMTALAGALLALPLRAAQAPPADAVLRVYDNSTRGLVLPKVVTGPQPQYTAAAMKARIGGSAGVDVTVGADGRVRDVLLAKSIDAELGLDDMALKAATRWVFEPGTLNGQPVAVRVRLDMAFNLR